jgi:hypothetical protein
VSASGIKCSHDAERGVMRFVIEIADADMRDVDLCPFDHAVLRDCGRPGASVADRLLGLELIFRRMEEQREKGAGPSGTTS